MWILLRSVNDYSQHGDYFVCAWHQKPTVNQVTKVLNIDEQGALYVLNGGGRRGYEDEWYYLFKATSGELYEG